MGPHGKDGRDGKDGTPGPIGLRGEQGERGEKGDRGLPGADGLAGLRGLDGKDGIGIKGEKGDRGPPGADGIDGADGKPGIDGKDGVQGPEGPRGLLPEIKSWRQDEITYRGEVVTYDGGCFQAVKDTAMVPGGKDWCMIAAPGKDGRSFRIRGVHKEGVVYDALDVVTLDRAWLVAKRDAPGPCPGPDWIAGPIGRKGDKGLHGERGPTGGKGEDAAPAREWVAVAIDRENFSLKTIMSDGSEGPTIDLRPLFDEYHAQRGGA